MLPLPSEQPTNHALLDLTSLLDVLFIILVFLLLSAAIKLDMLEVTLPTSGEQGKQVTKRQQVLSIGFEQQQVQYALNNTRYKTKNAVITALKNTNQPIYLAIDAQLPSHELVSVLAQLSEQGVAVANILTENK